MSGIRVCAATRAIFNFQKSRILSFFSETGPDFQSSTRTGSFFDNLLSNFKNASCFPEK